MKPCSATPRSRRAKEGGYVTAEAAMAFPALVLLVLGLLTGVAAMAAQIRCVDAAQAGARAAARGEQTDRAVAAAEGLAPKGARTQLTVRDGEVRFAVTSEVRLPGGPWSRIGFDVGHTAVAADEAAP
ncbi:TadE family type IV pilus minor pilin [Yinghuangia sp. ASG 101]|uniref:TadE family type IV pilus minor pilin n=1 Tax=Yinghuangia sp. ASG 101 TaxID=2896848 RepID=UPI003FCDE954